MTSDGHRQAPRQRLSVPPRNTQPPRALTDTELAALLRVADCLIPASGPNPKASDAEQYIAYLELALAARTDVFEAVVGGARKLSDVPDDELWDALKTMSAEDKFTFDPLSSVLAGAYFMTPPSHETHRLPGPAPRSRATGTGCRRDRQRNPRSGAGTRSHLRLGCRRMMFTRRRTSNQLETQGIQCPPRRGRMPVRSPTRRAPRGRAGAGW